MMTSTHCSPRRRTNSAFCAPNPSESWRTSHGTDIFAGYGRIQLRMLPNRVEKSVRCKRIKGVARWGLGHARLASRFDPKGFALEWIRWKWQAPALLVSMETPPIDLVSRHPQLTQRLQQYFEVRQRLATRSHRRDEIMSGCDILVLPGESEQCPARADLQESALFSRTTASSRRKSAR
jgi:hypothetical protein